MQIILTPEESEEYFHNALCNAVGTGYMNSYGIELQWNITKYKEAKRKLEMQNAGEYIACFEDILMQILKDGNSLTFKDLEGDGDNDATITLKDIHERVQLTPHGHLMNMISENDDAETADVILQTVFYKEIIFG